MELPKLELRKEVKRRIVKISSNIVNLDNILLQLIGKINDVLFKNAFEVKYFRSYNYRVSILYTGLASNTSIKNVLFLYLSHLK